MRMCTINAMRDDHLDVSRIVIGSVLTAALAVGLAEALLYHSTHTSHVGPTSATLSDVASEIGGACLGLAIGAMATAALVRRGSRVSSGLIVGSVAFVVGVAPYAWQHFSSDLSAADKAGGLLFVFVPAAVLVAVGALIGAAVRHRPPASPTGT
jgi:hypothetical protein